MKKRTRAEKRRSGGKGFPEEKKGRVFVRMIYLKEKGEKVFWEKGKGESPAPDSYCRQSSPFHPRRTGGKQKWSLKKKGEGPRIDLLGSFREGGGEEGKKRIIHDLLLIEEEGQI